MGSRGASRMLSTGMKRSEKRLDIRVPRGPEESLHAGWPGLCVCGRKRSRIVVEQLCDRVVVLAWCFRKSYPVRRLEHRLSGCKVHEFVVVAG
eukprot:scaffold24618_cov127-Cylindrotheca_fusiformis.AAC.1